MSSNISDIISLEEFKELKKECEMGGKEQGRYTKMEMFGGKGQPEEVKELYGRFSRKRNSSQRKDGISNMELEYRPREIEGFSELSIAQQLENVIKEPEIEREQNNRYFE